MSCHQHSNDSSLFPEAAKFSEKCQHCGDQLVVHAYRKKSRGKTKAIFAHCQGKDCTLHMREVSFAG